MNMSMIELWHSMGYFAKGIVYTLGIMSIYSLTIMIQKWWGLRKAQQETRKFAPEFSQFLEEDNLTEAIKLAEGYKKYEADRRAPDLMLKLGVALNGTDQKELACRTFFTLEKRFLDLSAAFKQRLNEEKSKAQCPV